MARRDRFPSGGGIISMGMRIVVLITMQLNNKVDRMDKAGENDVKMFSLEEEEGSRSFF